MGVNIREDEIHAIFLFLMMCAAIRQSVAVQLGRFGYLHPPQQAIHLPLDRWCGPARPGAEVHIRVILEVRPQCAL